MQENDLVADIVLRLSKADALDDIIAEVCQRTRYHWQDAEALVLRVRQERDEEIARRQRPLFTVMALAIFSGGLVFAGYGLYTIAQSVISHRALFPDDLTTYLVPVIESGANPIDSLEAASGPYLHMLAEFLFSPFSAIFVGTSMIVGSLRGMQDTWRNLINRWLSAFK